MAAVNTLVTRSVLRGYMQFLYSMLSSDVPAVTTAALHLLTAMVGTSLFAARHVYKVGPSR